MPATRLLGLLRVFRHTLRWLLGVWLLLSATAAAQQPSCPEQGHGLDPVAFETLTVGIGAIGLTAATINATAAAAAYLTLEAGNGSIRYTLFGNPSTGIGHLVDPPSTGNTGTGTGTWLCGRATLLGFKAIRSGGTDAILRVTYYTQR